MSLPVVLVTGFEPFAGATANPSGELARRLAESGHAGCVVVGEVLPVSFARAATALAGAIEKHRPDVVLALGLAEDRQAITPERVAINLVDARIPDNDGAQPIDVQIDAEGPSAHFSTLPVRAIAEAVDAAGIPSAISLTAGAYVCNHVFYELMRITAGRPGTLAGFIHIPATPDIGSAVLFTLNELERGIRVALTTVLGSRRLTGPSLTGPR